MTDEKFNKAVDEIVGFIVDVHKLQMDQLKCNIKAVYEANAHEVDPHAIATMIMNLPIERVQSREVQFKCEGCTDCKGNHKIISKDPVIEEGKIGDLADLSFVQNANEMDYNKEFYHHCPEMQDDLVRLTHSMSKGGRKCPVCHEEFESK